MKKSLFFLTMIMILGSTTSPAQNKKKMDNNNNNPLLCDPEEGFCAVPARNNSVSTDQVKADRKPVRIIYFTDPICSSCWGIEPQLRKLKLEYGNQAEIEYHMGGLLPDWSYNSGGINKPSDVAHHWDEVSAYYKMPIDGDVWLEDPLHSSYPPSIAFKAAQMQDNEKAVVFLRMIREMVFLEKKNITKWEHLAEAAKKSGLDPVQLKQDYEGRAKELFQADLDLAGQSGVRGFPTLFIVNEAGSREFVYGFKPYAVLEQAIAKIYPEAEKTPYDTGWESLFGKYPTLTTTEFATLSNLPVSACETMLEKLVSDKKLTKMATKNGVLWLAPARP